MRRPATQSYSRACAGSPASTRSAAVASCRTRGLRYIGGSIAIRFAARVRSDGFRRSLFRRRSIRAASACLSVSRADRRRSRACSKASFPSVWVSGEISNFSRPQSGHCYLTLKDDQAQIRAVIWRTAASRVRFDLHDGLEVICQGNLDVYAPRGSYQLVIQQIEPKGVGALELALAQAARAAGGRRAVRRRPASGRCRAFRGGSRLSPVPTGAAIRDFLEVLRRRWRGVDVLVVPVRVQGDGAAAEIAAGIELVNRLAHADRRAGRRPRRRQPGRPVGLQRRGRGPRDSRLAHSGRLGRGTRDRRHAGRPGGRRAGADAQRSGRARRAGGRRDAATTCDGSSSG